MPHRIVKSIFWLVGCTGLGLVLFQATQPSEAKIAEIRQSSQFSNDQTRRTALIMDKLKQSAERK